MSTQSFSNSCVQAHQVHRSPALNCRSHLSSMGWARPFSEAALVAGLSSVTPRLVVMEVMEKAREEGRRERREVVVRSMALAVPLSCTTNCLTHSLIFRSAAQRGSDKLGGGNTSFYWDTSNIQYTLDILHIQDV